MDEISITIAFVLLGERLSAWQVGGSLLILGGVVLLRGQEIWLARRMPRGGGKALAVQSATEPTRPG